MVSYQPASQPSKPACTRAATPGVDGCVRSTMKWASPSAPPTTIRATTYGGSASRTGSGSRAQARRSVAHAVRPGARGRGSRALPIPVTDASVAPVTSGSRGCVLGEAHRLVVEGLVAGDDVPPAPAGLGGRGQEVRGDGLALGLIGLVHRVPDQPDVMGGPSPLEHRVGVGVRVRVLHRFGVVDPVDDLRPGPSGKRDHIVLRWILYLPVHRRTELVRAEGDDVPRP